MTAAQVGLARAAPDTRSMLVEYWTPRRAAWLVVALGVVLRGWVSAAGFFYGDDYVLQGRAWRLPLDSSYLLHAQDGQLMPGALALQWAVTRLWPMNPAPLALLETVGSAAVIVLFARLALRLWGSRWLVMVPVTLVAVTPLTLPSSTWWAAALGFLPLQLALVLSIGTAVSWWRTRRQWHLWLGLLTWLPLLAFSEKVLLVPWVVLAALPVLDAEVGPLRAWARAVRAAPVVWAGYLILTAVYVVGYLQIAGRPSLGTPTTAEIAELLAGGTVTTVAPALLGGPLEWSPVGNGAALGQPPAWLVIVAAELLALLVVASVAVSVRARRAWVWAGALVVGDLLLVAVGLPVHLANLTVVEGPRVTADATIPIALAVGASLVVVAPHLRRALVTWGASPGQARVATRGGAGALCLVIAVLSIVSASRYREIWRANSSAVYVAYATRDLGAVKDGPPVIDQSVPESVLSALSFPYNQVSWLLGPVLARPVFGDPTTDLRVLDDLGRLTPGVVVGAAALPGPVAGCGWFERGTGTPIALGTGVVPFSHTVRVAYLASGDGVATLALADGPARQVDLHKGSHEVVLTLVGGGDQVFVSGLTESVGFCTDDVRVGQAQVGTP